MNGLPPPVDPGRESDLLLVAAPTRDAITNAYALLKGIARDRAGGRFGLVVDRAPSESEALVTYRNVADAARRYLAAQLDYFGYIPRELGWRHARYGGNVPRLVDAGSPRGHAYALLAASVAPGSAAKSRRASPV